MKTPSQSHLPFSKSIRSQKEEAASPKCSSSSGFSWKNKQTAKKPKSSEEKQENEPKCESGLAKDNQKPDANKKSQMIWGRKSTEPSLSSPISFGKECWMALVDGQSSWTHEKLNKAKLLHDLFQKNPVRNKQLLQSASRRSSGDKDNLMKISSANSLTEKFEKEKEKLKTLFTFFDSGKSSMASEYKLERSPSKYGLEKEAQAKNKEEKLKTGKKKSKENSQKKKKPKENKEKSSCHLHLSNNLTGNESPKKQKKNESETEKASLKDSLAKLNSLMKNEELANGGSNSPFLVLTLSMG